MNSLCCIGRWLQVADADPRARTLMMRHYSARHYRDARRRTKFIGPGEYLALMTVTCDALFVWRYFLDDAIPRQDGINCSVFRNEGPLLSSLLIREADELAWVRWPGERHYTYVDSHKIKSTNPGYCFIMAGWRKAGITKGGLTILERMPC